MSPNAWRDATGAAAPVLVTDDTLREGMQSPSAPNLDQDARVRVLEALAELGPSRAILAFPASGGSAQAFAARALEACAAGCGTLRPGLVARADPGDLDLVARLRDGANTPCDVYMFRSFSSVHARLGSEPTEARLEALGRAMERALAQGLGLRFVLEDATRSTAAELEPVLALVARLRPAGLVLADSVGAAGPGELRRLVAWCRETLAARGCSEVELELHAHNDRGLALANAMAALEEGVTVLHGTLFGLGERVGNAPTELLLANLALEGRASLDLRSLAAGVHTLASLLAQTIPDNHPLFGADAFATVSGTHAAWQARALALGRSDWAEEAYQLLPAAELGVKPRYVVGPNAGRALVRLALEQIGLPADDAVVARVLTRTERLQRNLDEAELRALARG